MTQSKSLAVEMAITQPPTVLSADDGGPSDIDAPPTAGRAADDHRQPHASPSPPPESVDDGPAAVTELQPPVTADQLVSAEQLVSADQLVSAEQLVSADQLVTADQLVSADQLVTADQLVSADQLVTAEQLVSGDQQTTADGMVTAQMITEVSVVAVF